MGLRLIYNYILKQGGPGPTQPTQSNETTGIVYRTRWSKKVCSMANEFTLYMVHIKFFFINDNGHPLKAQNKLFKLN